MEDIMIRTATMQDAARLLEIYGYYVTDTAVSFEYDVPTLAEFRKRIATTLEQYPYLVLEKDGHILGYSYAGVFKGRIAYRFSCEVTIYLDRTVRGNGYGRMLYTALEEALKEQGILNLYACVTDSLEPEDPYLTRASEKFHTRMGYRIVGRFQKCGYKFHRWYHMIWMEKLIGEHESFSGGG